MFKGWNRPIVVAIAAVLGAAIIALVMVGRHALRGDKREGPATQAGPSSARSAFRDNSDPGAPGGAAAVPPVEKQVENVMGSWRTGILNKDANAVVAADVAFRSEPEKFREALITSAETDADDRVRAFSTRVLGKLKDPTCAPVFVRLLNDKSQHVRLNAAWGLDELANTAEGRAAAKLGLPTLRAERGLNRAVPLIDFP